MKVLWLVNIIFPEAERLLGNNSELKSTGGWLVSSAEELAHNNIEICAVCQSSLVDNLKFIDGLSIKYAIIPENKDRIRYLNEIRNVYQPEIIHVHGTETPLGFVWVKEFGSQNVVLSIQGVLSAIMKYHHKGMSNWEILSNLTLHDLIRKTIWGEQRGYINKSRYERTLIQKLNYVIGRTSFDKAYLKSINPRIHYFHCNESLREEFYSGIWNYDSCEKHTIFLSQAHAPLKGLHYLLQALPIVLKKYPNTRIKIGGQNIINNSWMRLSGYGCFIRQLIKKHSLQSCVYFLGPLNANEMKTEILKANVFVCPSTIENSPNSLAEAQILGIPCIGSDAGGIPDFISSSECGFLYRYDDPVMLADCICEAFETSSQFDNTHMREISRKRHNRQENCKTTIKIYQEILSNN